MRFAWILPVLLAACIAVPPRPVPKPEPLFDPLVFFAGHTEGDGQLRIVLSKPRAVHVHGLGERQPDGMLRLLQDVQEDGKPTTHRVWRIGRTCDGRYTATLSDARGPVAVEVVGNRLHLRFHMAHGLAAEQWLVLQPGGHVAQNRMTVRKLGIVVARLDERIVRQP